MTYLRYLFFTVFVLPLTLYSFAQTANIQLRIQNIRGTEGQLVIGLFNNAESFKAKQNPFKNTKVDIADSVISLRFLAVPKGEYAVAVFHDENKDGKVNTKSMKIPVEGVGISGEMRKMRAPKFEDAVCSFRKSRQTGRNNNQTIKPMRSPRMVKKN